VDEDQYGQGNGIRVAHSLTATDTTQTINLYPQNAGATVTRTSSAPAGTASTPG